MKLSYNIMADHLRNLNLENHVKENEKALFSRAGLLPRDLSIMKPDVLHVCRLSDALRVTKEIPGMHYLCVRDRIKDSTETEEKLQGMIVVNENIEVEYLFNEILRLFSDINEWYQGLQDALIKEKGLKVMLNSCKDVIGNTINISDSAFMLLARTENVETDDEVSQLLLKHGYHPKETLDKFANLHRIESWEGNDDFIINDSYNLSKYVMVNKVFRFKNTYFAHVVMVCDHRPMTKGLLELFSMLTDVIAIYAERNWKDKNSFSHNYDSFLSDLLDGNILNAADIEKRCNYLGINPKGAFTLIVISVELGMGPTLGRIGRELTMLLPGIKVVIYRGQLVGILPHGKRSSQSDIFRDEIKEFLERFNAHAGVSNRYENLAETPGAYFQAVLALKYNNVKLHAPKLIEDLVPLPETSVICTFKNRFLHSIILENKDAEAIWRSSRYFDYIDVLYKKDSDHGTNNLKLLQTYLWCERKATETGQLMHMHRNNVIYRIDRIEKMLDISLDDFGTRLCLQVSLILLEYFGIEEKE